MVITKKLLVVGFFVPTLITIGYFQAGDSPSDIFIFLSRHYLFLIYLLIIGMPSLSNMLISIDNFSDRYSYFLGNLFLYVFTISTNIYFYCHFVS